MLITNDGQICQQALITPCSQTWGRAGVAGQFGYRATRALTPQKHVGKR